MRALLLLCIMAAVVYSETSYKDSDIDIEKIYSMNSLDTYVLSCRAASGKVQFKVEGLPFGVKLDSNRIVVSNDAPSGNHVLKITATDSTGNVFARIVNLGIVATYSVSNASSSADMSSASSSTQSSQFGSSSSSSGTYGTYGISGTSGTSGSQNGGITVTTTGGSSTGASGSGLSTTTTSGSTQAKLHQILTTYSSMTDASSVTYSENRYPQINFPTGSTPTINPTLDLIANSQAETSSENRNKITQSDVKLRAASERHQNAVKGITNIMTIIDQARANKNKLEKDITLYTNNYNKAVASQRSAQMAVYNIQVTVSQISSAMSNINNQIDQLNTQAAASKNEWTVLIQQRNQLQSQIGPFNAQKDGFQLQIDNINSQISKYRETILSNKANCDSASSQIKDYDLKMSQLDSQKNSLSSDIRALTLQYNQKKDAVDQLQRKLSQAIVDRDNTKLKLDKAQSNFEAIPARMEELTRSISSQKALYSGCASQQEYLKRNIDELTAQINSIKGKISDIDSKVQNIQQQISSITVKVTQYETSSPSNEGKINDLKSTLQYLREQYQKSTVEKNRLYSAGNDANNIVAYSRQNLEAAFARYKSEYNKQLEATQNLEKLRAEQALARLAVDQLIQQYTQALPYAIVPNGNGKTDVGAPAGNNPSGSALGPASNSKSASFTVSSWTNYLSQAYGAGINPEFSGVVNTLYSFAFSPSVSGNSISNNIRSASEKSLANCGGNEPVSSTTGRISAVRDTSFDIKTSNGSIQTVNVAPCTTLNSNRAEYIITAGDVAVVKGAQISSGVYNGQSVTCLSAK